jgi:hypothetical protein
MSGVGRVAMKGIFSGVAMRFIFFFNFFLIFCFLFGDKTIILQ